MSDPNAGSVEGGYFVLPSGNRMQASCHHRKAGACGGCFARLYVMMDEISAEPARAMEIVKRTGDLMKAENKKRRSP